MLRIVFGVLGGYLIMAVLVMVLFSLLYLLLGPERTFHPGGTEVTALWLWLALGVSALAAGVGGRVAIAVAQRNEAVMALAVAVLVLGLYTAWSSAGAPPSETGTPAELGMFEIARYAHQQEWYAWILPFLSAACVWFGGMNPRK